MCVWVVRGRSVGRATIFCLIISAILLVGGYVVGLYYQDHRELDVRGAGKEMFGKVGSWSHQMSE